MTRINMLGGHPILAAPKATPYQADAREFATKLMSSLPEGSQTKLFAVITGYDPIEIANWGLGNIIIPQHAWSNLNLMEFIHKLGLQLPLELLGCGPSLPPLTPKLNPPDPGPEMA